MCNVVCSEKIAENWGVMAKVQHCSLELREFELPIVLLRLDSD